MGSTYVSGERIKVGELKIGISLGTTMGAELLSRRGPTDVFLGGNGDGKYEDSCLVETT